MNAFEEDDAQLDVLLDAADADLMRRAQSVTNHSSLLSALLSAGADPGDRVGESHKPAPPSPGQFRVPTSGHAFLQAALVARTERATRTALQLLADTRARDIERVRIRAHNLAGDLHHVRDRDRTFVRDLGLRRVVILARDLDWCSALARDLTLARTSGRLRGVDLARALRNDLNRLLDLARSRALGPDLDRCSALVFDLARDLNRDLVLNRDLDLGFFRDLDLGLRVARDLNEALAFIINDEINHVLTQGFTQRLPGIDLESMRPEHIRVLLDDFTSADLRDVDLTGVDLTGIRWSEATQWPSATVVADVRRRSRETRPGSGVFEVIGATGADWRESLHV